MKGALICIGLVSALIPAGALATCYSTDFSTYGARLNENMSEAQVVQAIGYTPNTVSLSTCGGNTSGGGWACKIEVWGSSCHGDLRVYFEKVDGVWMVNNWEAEEALGF